MANKREFKKSTEALTAALVDEMMISYYNEEEADKEKISAAITKLVGALEKSKKTAAIAFDKKIKEFESMAAYNKAKAGFIKEKYNNAIADYNQALSEALKDYNEGMPKNKK